MVLYSRNLFIDTHYFIATSLDFESRDLSALLELSNKGLINIFLMDITVMEVEKKIRDEISKAYKKIKTSDCRYLRMIPMHKRFCKTYTESKAISFFLNKFYSFIRKCNIKIIKSEFHPTELFLRYCENKPPFNKDSSKNRKNEFPDAFALESISHWCKKNNQKTYILSGDSDWKSYVKDSCLSPFSEKSTLHYLEKLPNFLDAIVRNEKSLKNLAAFADNIVLSHQQDIEKNIINALNKVEFYSNRIDEGIKIINHGILSCSLESQEIISVDRNTADFSFELKIDAIFKYDVLDYDSSPYDSEDKHYSYTETEIIYMRHNWLIKCGVTLGFSDAIPENYEIISIDVPTFIDVEFNRGQYILFDKWLEELPVIICGVEKDKITENGFGAIEYKNITEAMKIFPELDIHKPSKNFTAAIGNKITGPLRFETWVANDLYSS